jgi:polyisoprenoid-binding protein YceI
MLRGEPFSPVGTTSQITGDIIVSNASGTPSANVGLISIDARTIHTDSAQRDGAINRLILKTGTPGNEYVTFKPTSFSGLPDQIVPGAAFSFSVTGDLTISGVTKSETLAITATLDGDTISGTMSGSFKRSDFNLVIPNIPFVANVSDEIKISSTFVATRVN